MQISRLKIDKYGAVRDHDWDLEPGMTLFFGSNESGKTLLVESIIKLLLDGDTGDFDTIERVTGNPSGFLLFEMDDGEIQVPGADYTDLFPADTKRSDIRNAFIIRDFDLRLPNREPDFGHSRYLRDVTDRMMGSQTQKIESVRERIAEIGHLANKDSNRLMNQKPLKLKSRRDDADELAIELDEYLQDCRDEGVLEKVRKKRQNEVELERVEKNIEKLEKAEKQEKFNKGQGLVEDLQSIKEELQGHEDREDEVRKYRDLRDSIDDYRDQASENIDPGTYQKAAYVIAPLLALSLIAAIASPLAGMSIVSGILLLTLLFVGYKYFDARGELTVKDGLVQDANFAEFEGDDLPTVYTAIESKISEYKEDGNLLTRKESDAFGELRGRFDADHDSLEEWEEEIDAFGEEVEAVDREFDEVELGHLESRRNEIRMEIADLRSDLNAHRDKLSTLNSKITEIGPVDYLEDVDEIQVNSVEDLQEVVRILERFVSALNAKRDTARTAIEIFKELEEEEEQEINQLFIEDDFIVDTFYDVTDGNYIDVWYDEGEGTVRVKRSDDQEFTPYQLSQGTYDLLYLILRLKLAQKLLDDDSGFLILDDVFLHSDSERAGREIEMLDRLAGDGWQIVYFTCRDSVKDAVASADNGNVVELERLEFTS